MSDLYPPESQKLDIFGHLEELRRRILICLGVLVILSVAAFARGRDLIFLMKEPAEGLIPNLIFISPTEVFAVYVKVSLLAGFILSFPVILHQTWAFVSPALNQSLRKNLIVWMALALIGFFAGIVFSFFCVIPAALKFLIGFGEGLATPAVTLSQYVSFFTILILLGGVVFEIPTVMGLLTDIGILQSSILRKTRRYAIFFIMIAAAVLTPTQDIFNMLIFALPMLALYEMGIGISVFVEKRKK